MTGLADSHRSILICPCFNLLQSSVQSGSGDAQLHFTSSSFFLLSLKAYMTAHLLPLFESQQRKSHDSKLSDSFTSDFKHWRKMVTLFKLHSRPLVPKLFLQAHNDFRPAIQAEPPQTAHLIKTRLREKKGSQNQAHKIISKTGNTGIEMSSDNAIIEIRRERCLRMRCF